MVAYQKKSSFPAGYTMIEILLVLGMTAVLAGISMPIVQSFQVKNYMDLGASNFVQAIRRAQLLSQTVERDSNWGVKVETGQVILFKGASYSGRDMAFDEVTELPESVLPSGDTEFVFNKLTGEPFFEGILTLTTNRNEQRTLTVNKKGIVEF